MSLFQRISCVPVTYVSDPFSATMRPYLLHRSKDFCMFISAATVRMQVHAIESSEVPAGPVAILECRRELPRQNGAADPIANRREITPGDDDINQPMLPAPFKSASPYPSRRKLFT